MPLLDKDALSVTTLAVAGGLGAALVSAIMGNDLGVSLDGDNVSTEQMQMLIQQRIIEKVGAKRA